MKENNTIDLLMGRSSLRNFSDREVPDNVIKTVLEAAMRAPTAGNLQPYSILVLKKSGLKDRIAKLFEGQPWVEKSPVHLIFLLDHYRLKRWAEAERAPFTAMKCLAHFIIGMQDTIICAQSACTAADAIGLGSVYIGTVIHLAEEIKRLLKLPDFTFPVTLLCVGYPAGGGRSPTARLPYEAVVHEGRYGDFTDGEVKGWYDEKYGEWRSGEKGLIEKTIETAKAVMGKRKAKEIERLLENRGFITMAQRYFGTHYRADRMPLYDRGIVEALIRSGFRIGLRRPRRTSSD